jgi:hypothetical protein
MRSRTTLLLAVVALATPLPAMAQAVRGRVMDDSTGVPIGLVEVRLLDAQGAQRGGAVSATTASSPSPRRTAASTD